MQRSGNAVWRGAGKDGSGTVSTPSGALKEQPYSFRTRFEDESGRAGTNPEELIAAAHAGCFSMALSNNLATAGHTPERVHTTAKVDFGEISVGLPALLQAFQNGQRTVVFA